MSAEVDLQSFTASWFQSRIYHKNRL